MDTGQIKTFFDSEFRLTQEQDWPKWKQDYLGFITEVDGADERTFKSLDFQENIWHQNPVSSIGPSQSISVGSVAEDPSIIGQLWELKNAELPISLVERASFLQNQYDALVTKVAERHSESGKKSWARVARVFATLFPHNVFCVVSSYYFRLVERALGFQPKGQGDIYRHVILRDYFREVIGDEPTLEDAVDFSQFSWWIAERENARRNKPDAGERGSLEPATDVPEITILPAQVQTKGMFYVGENIPLLQSIVETALDGATRLDLIDVVLEQRSDLSSTSAANIVNQARQLNLLRFENNTFFLSELGKELQEGADPADILAPVMIRKVLGFAHLLKNLRDEEEAVSRDDMINRLRAVYPNWTTNFAPGSLISWARQLGLIDVSEQGDLRATESGEYWASALPADMSDWIIKAEPVARELLEEIASEKPNVELVGANFDQLSEHFDKQGLIVPKNFLQSLHGALHASEHKRFVLLTGLSGTGKTSIARAYARAYCHALGLEYQGQYKEVSVWPDWTDPTGLLGFVNPLGAEPTYQRTPALELLLRAVRNPGKPYFLCLDEMNLARVEHYFAPFLSAMEGREGNQTLSLHPYEGAIDNVPAQVMWPSNLFILGTVNMDESTHPFSDKVLDRAFTFELWDVDLSAWRDANEGDGSEQFAKVFEVLSALYNALFPARLHFGYRSCDEVLRFCDISGDAMSTVDALDAAVYAKILPKIRGENSLEVQQALAQVVELCQANGLEKCQKKIAQMASQLERDDVVRFWS